MSITLPAPGPLYAALQVCHSSGLPDWLNDVTPRCATAAAPLQLDEQQAEQLAELAAAAWWECQQADDDGHPLVAAFSTACEEALALLERTAS